MMAAVVVAAFTVAAVSAQGGGQKPATTGVQAKPGAPVIPPPPKVEEYAIGAADVVRIVVVGSPEMSGDFVVRPDGKITMLQIDEIVVAGLKPEELKKKVKTELKRFYEDPVPEVFVEMKAINSRMAFVQGAVNRVGAYPIIGEMRISQLITIAGGLQEFADKKKILVISSTQKKPNGDPVTWFINYDELMQGKNLRKNDIVINPGDTIIVRGG